MFNPDLASTGTTPEKWDDVRARFKGSMMAKTELHKLAANLDMSWPMRGRDEIPLKYLPHTLDELLMFPEIGEKPARLGLLVSILEETMAFDDPFGEMAEHVDSSSKKDDSAEKAMQMFGIDEAYPIRLCHLSADTLAFCEAEHIKTVGEFVAMTQTMAQSVVVGGDFRGFLNGFVSSDETALAAYLPIRNGQSGLHLPEAIGLVVRDGDPAEQAALFRHFDVALPAELAGTEKVAVEAVVTAAQDAVNARLVYFSAQADDLKAAFAQDPSAIERFFVPLNDPGREKVAIELARACLAPDSGAKKGFLSRLFGR